VTVRSKTSEYKVTRAELPVGPHLLPGISTPLPELPESLAPRQGTKAGHKQFAVKAAKGPALWQGLWLHASPSSIRRLQHVLSLTKGRPVADPICGRLASGACLEAFQALALSAVKESREAEQAASEQDEAAGFRRSPPNQILRIAIFFAVWV